MMQLRLPPFVVRIEIELQAARKLVGRHTEQHTDAHVAAHVRNATAERIPKSIRECASKNMHHNDNWVYRVYVKPVEHSESIMPRTTESGNSHWYTILPTADFERSL